MANYCPHIDEYNSNCHGLDLSLSPMYSLGLVQGLQRFFSLLQYSSCSCTHNKIDIWTEISQLTEIAIPFSEGNWCWPKQTPKMTSKDLANNYENCLRA